MQSGLNLDCNFFPIDKSNKPNSLQRVFAKEQFIIIDDDDTNVVTCPVHGNFRGERPLPQLVRIVRLFKIKRLIWSIISVKHYVLCSVKKIEDRTIQHVSGLGCEV